MSDIITNSIQKIAKGSSIIFIGTLSSLFFGLLTNIIIVRFMSREEFGIYSLALTIVTVCITISTLGLQEGTTRFIAHFRAKNERTSIKDTICSSILISLLSSILITILITSFSNYVAINIFKIREISRVLQILGIAIPFIVLSDVLISVFRGFDKAMVRVYFSNIMKPILYLCLLVLAVHFKLSFTSIISTYVVSAIITFLALFLYFTKKSPQSFSWKQLNFNNRSKELLRYSVPLLMVTMLLSIMAWTDTLMLGYFKNPEIVGAYNAAHPIGNLLSTGINSIGYLYVPVISYLYSKNQIKELGKINESSTKWCFIITFPIFFFLFLFPEFVLNIFYGDRYVETSNVLKVLVLGHIANSFFGLNYFTLLSAGKSRLLMYCSSIGAFMNVIFNLILIPQFGMLGAAIASAISFTVIEVVMTYKLYQFLRIHPFTKLYIKFVLIEFILLGICYELKLHMVQTFWTISGLYAFFLIMHISLIFLTKSLDKEDIKMLVQLEKKVGIKLTFIKKLVVSTYKL